MKLESTGGKSANDERVRACWNPAARRPGTSSTALRGCRAPSVAGLAERKLERGRRPRQHPVLSTYGHPRSHQRPRLAPDAKTIRARARFGKTPRTTFPERSAGARPRAPNGSRVKSNPEAPRAVRCVMSAPVTLMGCFSRPARAVAPRLPERRSPPAAAHRNGTAGARNSPQGQRT